MIKEFNTIKNSTRYLIILFLVLLLVVSRNLSFIPNFTPTISLIVFASTMFRNYYILASIVIASQLISDYFLGYYSSIFFVYLGYILLAFASKFILKEIYFVPIIGTSIISVFIFFLVSNYGVWQMMDIYEYSLSGLIECYIAGIPFLKYSLISTLLYSTTMYVLFRSILFRYLGSKTVIYK